VASFDDYAQIQRLEAAHLPFALPVDDWRGLFVDNPLWPQIGKDWPIGWVLENDTGQVVGSLTNIPSAYRFRNRELICGSGRAWAVDDRYRGFAMWLMDEYFNQPGVDLFVNTTFNLLSTATANLFSTRIPVGDWETFAFWVTSYRGFTREALGKMRLPLAGALVLPAAAALWLKDALFSKSSVSDPSVTVAAADSFDSRFDVFWGELLRLNPDKLLGVRNRQALSWHFSIPMRRKHLWIFTASRNGLLRAYCVLNRHDGTYAARRMRLIDYQTVEPDNDLLPGLLKAALKRCAVEKIDFLEHLGRGLPKMQCIDNLAPYRYKNPNWPFYYHVPNPALRAELCVAQVWDPSEFDGDASFQ